MALGSTQPLVKNAYQEHFLGVKAAGAWGWQHYHLHVPNVMKIWEPKPPGTLWDTPGLLRDDFEWKLDFLERFLKNTQIWNFMKARPLGGELLRAVGRTDKHDEAGCRLSQFCEGAWQLLLQNDVTSSLQTTHFLSCLCVHCWIINI